MSEITINTFYKKINIFLVSLDSLNQVSNSDTKIEERVDKINSNPDYFITVVMLEI